MKMKKLNVWTLSLLLLTPNISKAAAAASETESSRDNAGRFLKAVVSGNLEDAKEMLGSGHDADEKHMPEITRGYNPLHTALILCGRPGNYFEIDGDLLTGNPDVRVRFSMAELLLDNDADPNKKNHDVLAAMDDDASPLGWFLRDYVRCTDPKTREMYESMIGKLMSKGADVNTNAPDGTLPMHSLVATDAPMELMEAMFGKLNPENKRRVDAFLRTTASARPFAREMGFLPPSLDVIEFLLAHGANPKAVDPQGKSALSIARKAKDVEAVGLLEAAAAAEGEAAAADPAAGAVAGAAATSAATTVRLDTEIDNELHLSAAERADIASSPLLQAVFNSDLTSVNALREGASQKDISKALKLANRMGNTKIISFLIESLA